MSSYFRLIAFAFSSLLLISTGFGQSVKIEGEVKGVNNAPAKGADLRVDRVDKKAAPVIAKTDAKGRFAATVLEVGTYKVTATMPGGIQSAKVIKAEGKKLFLTFDMKPTSAKTVAAVTKKRSIWVPSPTGTHMLGHWEEIDENSPTHTRTVQGQNVEYMTGRDLEGWDRNHAVLPKGP